MPALTEFTNSINEQQYNVLSWDGSDRRIRLSQYPAGMHCAGRWCWQAYTATLSASSICDTVEQAHTAVEIALAALVETEAALDALLKQAGVRP